MKKFIALMLALVMAFAFAGCSEPAANEDVNAKSEGVMTYAEYADAALDSEVAIEGYVQAKQSWWDNQASLYLQDGEGAYFVYNAACSEEDYGKLELGTKVKVTGYKAEWAGEVEVIDATIEVMEGNYVAEVMDATELLGSDDLINHQNKLVAFKGLTVEASTDAAGNEAAFLYSWDGSGAEGTDADLYFNASINGETYTFVIEYYVCDADGNFGAETEVYETVRNLQVGDTIDMEGFLYWYEGAQPHVTSVTVA